MKTKVSATVDEDRLATAQRLTGCTSVSAVLDRALQALITEYLERAHADGYARAPQAGETVASPDPAMWAGLPWDDDV